MRFMMFMKVQPGVYELEQRPEDFEPMTKYNEELSKAGALLALDGLQPPSHGARIEFGAEGPSVVDGPYAEAKEIVGGYWIIQTKTREEAVEWASRVPAREGEAIELRQVFELSDFPDEVQDVVADHDVAPREQPVDTL